MEQIKLYLLIVFHTIEETRPAFCELKSEPGICKAAIQRYFFNKKSGNCELFTFGGCRGNKNNFKTIEDCKKACQGISHFM